MNKQANKPTVEGTDLLFFENAWLSMLHTGAGVYARIGVANC